jgi:hypothetical protein
VAPKGGLPRAVALATALQYFVVPDIELATVARLWTALSD